MGHRFWVVKGGLWQIGGLRKVHVGSLDAMVGMVDLYMRCNAVVNGLMKEIDGLKKVSVQYLDAMVGKAEDWERQSIVKSIMKGNRERKSLRFLLVLFF